jgi:hypothetical protein
MAGLAKVELDHGAAYGEASRRLDDLIGRAHRLGDELEQAVEHLDEVCEKFLARRTAA